MGEFNRTFDAVVLVPGEGPHTSALCRSGEWRSAGAEVAVACQDCLPKVLSALAGCGIGPGQVLVLADGPLPAVPPGLTVASPTAAELDVMVEEQRRRRECGRVPGIDEDPAWTLCDDERDPLRRRVIETVFTLGAGGFATRGAVEERRPGSVPMVLASGIYTGSGHSEHLLPAPSWTGLEITPEPTADRRVLDLRAGVLLREENLSGVPLRTLRFASIARPGVVALRAEAAVGRIRPGSPLRRPEDVRVVMGLTDHLRWAKAYGSSGGVTTVADQRWRRDGDVRTVERIVAYGRAAPVPPQPATVRPVLEAARRAGFDRLLAEHRSAWAQRWHTVDVEIPDDPETQLAARFALFQLWGNVNGGGEEAAVGAHGLSGPGSAGHVSWAADVFVLPAVVSMSPAAARAMVDYRAQRLPAARAAGCAGARFPWESTSDGHDVTPTSGTIGGHQVEISTGQLAEHITADVAWAAAHCAAWTGDQGFLCGRRRLLVVDTARYWASRARRDGTGRAHIDAVIGPDEYHESVSDNAFTNVMARWNLCAAARLLADSGHRGEEAERWTGLAASLVDGYQPETGLYEQFAGYFDLAPLEIGELARTPVAVDVPLDRKRVATSQIIKQPDVLMLHHMVPGEVHAGSLVPNIDFYGPRTAHSSSLSPAISASLLARAGRADEALALLRTALWLDIDDRTGTTAAGLHLATMGGVWQALLLGFAGVRVHAGVLWLDPKLPAAWRSLGLKFRCLGRAVGVRITEDAVHVRTDGPLRVGIDGCGVRLVTDSAVLDRA